MMKKTYIQPTMAWHEVRLDTALVAGTGGVNGDGTQVNTTGGYRHGNASAAAARDGGSWYDDD